MRPGFFVGNRVTSFPCIYTQYYSSIPEPSIKANTTCKTNPTNTQLAPHLHARSTSQLKPAKKNKNTQPDIDTKKANILKGISSINSNISITPTKRGYIAS